MDSLVTGLHSLASDLTGFSLVSTKIANLVRLPKTAFKISFNAARAHKSNKTPTVKQIHLITLEHQNMHAEAQPQKTVLTLH